MRDSYPKDDEELAWEAVEEAERAAFEEVAVAQPSTDYYDRYPATRPKQEIGEYVASQGFRVPLTRSQSEWEQAFDAYQAMIRSDLAQDYAGYSGILDSVLLDEREQSSIMHGGDHLYPESSIRMRHMIGTLFVAGLRSGDLDGGDFIRERDQALSFFGSTAVNLARFGDPHKTDVEHDVTASRWRYIAGANIRLFRDPIVDGRYHIGAFDGSSSGDFFDLESAPETIKPRKCRTDLPIQPIVDFYEAIRTLPRFDQRQCPVIEMQLDKDGELHFLQYLKTGKLLAHQASFALPFGPGVEPMEQSRGTTEPEGRPYKVYIEPPRFDERLRDNGYLIALGMYPDEKDQILAVHSGLAVHQFELSLKGNHFTTAPLYRPELAVAGFKTELAYQGCMRLVDASRNFDTQNFHYIDAHVTANGREATFATDWQIKTEEA